MVCMMYCACVHAENNITRLTKSFFSTDRRTHEPCAHTHTHTLPHSGGHVFCTACHYRSLDVVTGWHWGFLLLSFYDNFHSLALRYPLPSSFSHSFPPPLFLSFMCTLILPLSPLSFHSIPPPSVSHLVQTHIHFSCCSNGTPVCF